VSKRAAAALASPADYADRFPDLDWALKAEALYNKSKSRVISASDFSTFENSNTRDLIEAVKKLEESGRLEAMLSGEVEEKTEEVPEPATTTPVVEESPAAPVAEEVAEAPEEVAPAPAPIAVDPTPEVAVDDDLADLGLDDLDLDLDLGADLDDADFDLDMDMDLS